MLSPEGVILKKGIKNPPFASTPLTKRWSDTRKINAADKAPAPPQIPSFCNINAALSAVFHGDTPAFQKKKYPYVRKNIRE